MESNAGKNLAEKISLFHTVEILVNEKKEMIFEGVIDPPYIQLHFERVVRSSRYFDIVRMVGYQGNRKETIAEVVVSE